MKQFIELKLLGAGNLKTTYATFIRAGRAGGQRVRPPYQYFEIFAYFLRSITQDSKISVYVMSFAPRPQYLHRLLNNLETAPALFI